MRKKTEKGFTLIELLVVIAIIGLLSSIVMASLNQARAKARDARRQSDLHEINNAINLFIADNGHAPYLASLDENCDGANIGTWSSSAACPALDRVTLSWQSLANELDPYIKALPKDPCGARCDLDIVDSTDEHFEYLYFPPAEVCQSRGSGQICNIEDYLLVGTGLEEKAGVLNYGPQLDETTYTNAIDSVKYW